MGGRAADRYRAHRRDHREALEDNSSMAVEAFGAQRAREEA